MVAAEYERNKWSNCVLLRKMGVLGASVLLSDSIQGSEAATRPHPLGLELQGRVFAQEHCFNEPVSYVSSGAHWTVCPKQCPNSEETSERDCVQAPTKRKGKQITGTELRTTTDPSCCIAQRVFTVCHGAFSFSVTAEITGYIMATESGTSMQPIHNLLHEP